MKRIPNPESRITVGLLLTTSIAMAMQDDPKTQNARAVAEMLAGCTRLYEDYAGRVAQSLPELVKRSDGIEFWPEGGFFPGDLPKDPWGGEYRIADRAVVCSREGVKAPLAPLVGTRIVPPNDRLRNYYAARVQVGLLALAGRAHFDATGAMPSKREDFGRVPKDPWGGEYAIEFRKHLVLIKAADAAKARVTPTEEERAAMRKAAAVPLSAEERKLALAEIERAADDDLATREAAMRELSKLGRRARPLVEERLAKEKDRFATLWLRRVLEAMPAGPDTWERHLGALVAVVHTQRGQDLAQVCATNLEQLWKMQCNYMAQFGGADKPFPQDIGKDFWLKLVRTTPPLVDETLADIFVCPGSGVAAGKEACTYHGPALDINNVTTPFGDGDPVGMCDDECHGGFVVILRKSSDVMMVGKNDPLYQAALKWTKR